MGLRMRRTIHAGLSGIRKLHGNRSLIIGEKAENLSPVPSKMCFGYKPLNKKFERFYGAKIALKNKIEV